MAVAAAHLVTNSSGANATSYTTASVAPTANALVLIWVAHNDTKPTVSGNGLTWVEVLDENLAAETPDRRMTLFRAMGASPSAEAITIDMGAATQSRCAWSVIEFTGVDTTGTNGSGAVVQAVANDNGEVAATSLAVTLAAFGSADNATAGGFMHVAIETSTEGDGFTVLGNIGATESRTLLTEWKASNDTSVDASWASSVRCIGIAVEIKAGVVTDVVKDIIGGGITPFPRS